MTILVADFASFDQVLPIALEFGVGLEFQDFINPKNLENPDALAQNIRAKAKDLPSRSMHGAFAEMVPASWDPWVRQAVRNRFEQAYNIAQVTGAQHLILHSGFIPKTYQRENWIQNTYEFWIDFLKDKPTPGFFHIENVYEDDFSTLLEMIDRVNQDFSEEVLTICLDIGHVNANSKKGFEDWISSLGDRIRYVHLHNNGGILDDHWRLGKGTINLKHVLALLQEHAPQAAWSVETVFDDILPSLRWLQVNNYL